jgi:hypothetical protein
MRGHEGRAISCTRQGGQGGVLQVGRVSAPGCPTSSDRTRGSHERSGRRRTSWPTPYGRMRAGGGSPCQSNALVSRTAHASTDVASMIAMVALMRLYCRSVTA